MDDVDREGDLEIAQDLDFQRRQWVAQRIGWVMMGLVVLAALAGLMGAGPLSKSSVGDLNDGLKVMFLRFDRRHAPSEVRMVIAGDAIREGEVRMWISREFLNRIELEQVIPEPEEVRSEPDREVYVFQAGGDPSQPIEVTFQFQQDAFGVHTADVGLVDGPALTFWQLVYP